MWLEHQLGLERREGVTMALPAGRIVAAHDDYRVPAAEATECPKIAKVAAHGPTAYAGAWQHGLEDTRRAGELRRQSRRVLASAKRPRWPVPLRGR